MKTREDFIEYFDATLKDELGTLEARRRVQNKRKFNATVSIVALIVVNFIVFGFFKVSFWFLLGSVPAIAWLSVWFFQQFMVDNNLNSDFKEFVIKKMMAFIAPNFEYHPSKYVSFKLYEQSKLYPSKPEHYKGDDMFMGIVKNVPVQFCELKTAFTVEKKEKTKTQKVLSPIFHGLFLVAVTKKNFNTNIFIYSDNIQQKFNALGKSVQEFNFNRTNFVDIPYANITDEFGIYADDPNVARASLSEDFLSLLLDFKQHSNIDFRLSFIGNKMFLAIPFGREMFEIDMKKSLMDVDSLLPYFEDLNFGISIVDILHLDKVKEVKKESPFPPEFFS